MKKQTSQMLPTQHRRIRRAPSEAWLSSYSEPALYPELPIIDAHHHLWDLEGWRYLLPEYLQDISCSGHAIEASVYVTSTSMWRVNGVEHMRPVGETEFATGIAAMSASGIYGAPRICAAIIGHADLKLGKAVNDVLDAHQAAGGQRFRGIRHTIAHDAEAALVRPGNPAEAGLLENSRFKDGFAELGKRRMLFEAWLYHPQINAFADFAALYPDTRIVVNHFGGPLGCGKYERQEVLQSWSSSIRRLAKCENVSLKLGGLGMPINGFGLQSLETPASSVQLADLWRPYIDVAISAFGVDRCLFESNFPVDKVSYSYGTFWNACKRLTEGYSASEREALFYTTASRIYGLDRL